MPFFRLDDWGFRVGCIGFVAAVLASTVPHWIFYVPDSLTWGLRATCRGERCGAIDFSLLKATLNCNNNCAENLDQFRLRFRVVEGFGWFGVALLLYLAAGIRIGYERDVRPTALGVPVVFISIAAVMALGVSLATFGGSLECAKGCFEYGASAICKLTAIGVATLCIPMGLIASKLTQYRQSFGRGTFALALVAVALEVASLTTNRWIFKTRGGALDAVNFGLFQTCTDNKCTTPHYQSVLALGPTVGCRRSETDLLDRFRAGKVLFLLAAVGCVALAVLTRSGDSPHAWRRGLVALSLAVVTAANGVVFVTLEDWIFCGRTYCEVTARGRTNTACNWGFSAAMALATNLMLGVLAVMEAVEWLYTYCEVEETEGATLLRAKQQEAAERKEATRLRLEREEKERVHASRLGEARDAVAAAVAAIVAANAADSEEDGDDGADHAPDGGDLRPAFDGTTSGQPAADNSPAKLGSTAVDVPPEDVVAASPAPSSSSPPTKKDESAASPAAATTEVHVDPNAMSGSQSATAHA